MNEAALLGLIFHLAWFFRSGGGDNPIALSLLGMITCLFLLILVVASRRQRALMVDRKITSYFLPNSKK